MDERKHYKCGHWIARPFGVIMTARDALKHLKRRDDEFIMSADLRALAASQQFSVCCARGDIPRIRYLLETGYAEHIDYGLRVACYYNQLETVMELIRLGAKDMNEGLRGAANGGHLELFQLMLEYGADDLNMALACACSRNNDDMVRLLISEGATNCGCGHSMAAHPVGYLDDDIAGFGCICNAAFSEEYCDCRSYPYTY